MEQNNESFVFYRSFFEAAESLKPSQQGELLMAVADYSLNGIIRDMTPMIKPLFALIKPQLDANLRRRANGHKGGRPKTKSEPMVIEEENQNITKIKPKHNQTITKIKPNHNQTITESKANANANANVNANANTKEKSKKEIVDEVINLYHECCPSLPRISKLNDHRIKAINARLEDYTIDELKEIFIKAEHSDFLKNGQGTWTGANFDWIMNPTNICKIAEGCYKNKDEPKKKQEEEVRVAVGYRFNENYQMEPVYDREEWEAWKREHPE